MFWYPSIIVVAALCAVYTIWTFFPVSAFIARWLVVGGVLAALIPLTWLLPQRKEPLTIFSVMSSCVAVLWLPTLLYNWSRGQLSLDRGLPNILFASMLVVYYLVYRKRDHEHMLSGMFMQDKYGVVLMYALLKVWKHAPTYLTNAEVLRIHVMQIFGATLTFTFSTSRPDEKNYNPMQAYVHQMAVGVFATITCVELLVRKVDEVDFWLHMISYGLLALGFVILNSNVKAFLPHYHSTRDEQQRRSWFRFTAAVIGIEIIWMSITI